MFDRWDSCYLYSGVYLMYVSEKIKNDLRVYDGRFVLLDATDVYQPINPGDGLIRKHGAIETGKARSTGPQIKDLRLTLTPRFEKRISFELVIENVGREAVRFEPGELAPTLFGPKSSWPFMPADGPSEAIITRTSLQSVFENREGGDSRIKVSAPEALNGEQPFFLAPDKSLRIVFTLELDPGAYDFVVGYGGGVHESELLVTSMFAFDVDANRRPVLISVHGHPVV